MYIKKDLGADICTTGYEVADSGAVLCLPWLLLRGGAGYCFDASLCDSSVLARARSVLARCLLGARSQAALLPLLSQWKGQV